MPSNKQAAPFGAACCVKLFLIPTIYKPLAGERAIFLIPTIYKPLAGERTTLTQSHCIKFPLVCQLFLPFFKAKLPLFHFLLQRTSSPFRSCLFALNHSLSRTLISRTSGRDDIHYPEHLLVAHRVATTLTQLHCSKFPLVCQLFLTFFVVVLPLPN